MSNYTQAKPLAPRQIQIIQDCVPILELLDIRLGDKFYKRLVKKHASLKPYFNETNNKLLRQPRAFAYTILMYAKHIEDLTPLQVLLNRIVSRHIGLQVKPEQYALLGEVFVETMVDLFPPGFADSEFKEAWTVAYANLASMLINAERVEYSKKQWDGFREFRVTRLTTECCDTKSFYITPVDGEPIPMPKRGQYLCMRWHLPNEKMETTRIYSISEFPKDNEYRLTVRYIPGGKVSGYIHNELQVGDSVFAGPPCGDCCYESRDSDMVVLAGGNGIAALMPVIEGGLQENRNVKLLFSNRTTDSRAFGELLRTYKKVYGDRFAVIEYLSRRRAIDPVDVYYRRSLTLEDLDFITPQHDVYLIGPRSYMIMIDDYLSAKKIQFKMDYYGPTVLNYKLE
ncbi:Flavohemoprotein [Candida viswanathii]|uniref:nitric oxide dioxygenase n=1 Tax=Candida viswanathii TaxID=5486 RepID=A0A367YLY5_9ASCO|nr:Flavohemoprotein [Candida viswanathii]